MGKIVVSENVSLDGVVQDPTGEEGFRHGGWFNQIGDKDREGWAKVGPAVGSPQLRVPRSALAIPDWRVGGQVEQPAQVRRVVHPHRP